MQTLGSLTSTSWAEQKEVLVARPENSRGEYHFEAQFFGSAVKLLATEHVSRILRGWGHFEARLRRPTTAPYQGRDTNNESAHRHQVGVASSTTSGDWVQLCCPTATQQRRHCKAVTGSLGGETSPITVDCSGGRRTQAIDYRVLLVAGQYCTELGTSRKRGTDPSVVSLSRRGIADASSKDRSPRIDASLAHTYAHTYANHPHYR